MRKDNFPAQNLRLGRRRSGNRTNVAQAGQRLARRYTGVTLVNGSGGAAPKLTVTYYRCANGNGQVDLQVPGPWVAARPEMTLTIGNGSVFGLAGVKGRAEGNVSLTRPLGNFNTVRGEQGTAKIAFDGKSFSWTAPSFDSVLQALAQCAA